MSEEKEKIEEQDEPLKVPEPEKTVVKTIDHTKSSNIDDDLGNQLSRTEKEDLTDEGETTLHKHDTRYLYKENTTAFTPDAAYEPATKKYVDELKYYATSSDTYATEDTALAGNTTTYTKKKTITLGSDWATRTVRIRFGLQASDSAQTAYGRIYKNGVAYGTERTDGAGAGYVYFNEDLEFTANDEIQLYLKYSINVGVGSGSNNDYFRILGTSQPLKYTTTTSTP